MTTTISDQELDYRIDQAAIALFDGKNVRFQPGIFKAAGLTPRELIKQLLNSLRCQELEWLQGEYGVTCDYVKPRQWRVYITRKSGEQTFVIKATTN